MTHSAIKYDGRFIFVNDPDIRNFISAVSRKIYIREDLDWLAETCAEWMIDHETYPPGLRDINLCDAVSNDDRLRDFVFLLETLKNSKISDEFYDFNIAGDVAARIISMMRDDR